MSVPPSKRLRLRAKTDLASLRQSPPCGSTVFPSLAKLSELGVIVPSSPVSEPDPSMLTQPVQSGSQRLRLRSKTASPQTALVGVALVDEANNEKGRMVYCVTFPHPQKSHSQCGIALVPPESMLKSELLEKFQDSCERPIYVDRRGMLESRSVPLRRVGVFREMHKQDENGDAHAHDHLAVLAARYFMFNPVKRALLQRYGLASHWSVSHDLYWSPLNYLSRPSPEKPFSSLDPSPILWAADGLHPPVHECNNPPMTMEAIRARRQYVERSCAEDGKKQPRVSEMDLWPIVVANDIKNTPDDPNGDLHLMAWVKEKGTLEMQQFCFKQRAKLKSLIDDIWRYAFLELVL